MQQAGIQEGAKEIVFFGADLAKEEIRGREVEKAFARSLSVQDAMREENMLAFEMNGKPLPTTMASQFDYWCPAGTGSLTASGWPRFTYRVRATWVDSWVVIT